MKKVSSKKSEITESADSFNKAGESLLVSHDYQGALVKFNQALHLDTKHPAALKGKLSALLSLAALAEKKEDHNVAISHYAQAHDIDPDDAKTMQILARIRFEFYQSNHPFQEFDVPTASYFIENLVLQGGGIKGLAYLAALERLFKSYIDRRQIKRVAGTSAGGITALLIALPFTIDEMKAELQQLKFTDLMDGEYREKLLYLLQNKEQIGQLTKGFAAELGRVKEFKQKPFQASSAASTLLKHSNTPDAKLIREGLSLLTKDQFGLFPGNYLREHLIERLIQQKTGIAYCTFAELHALHLKEPERYKDLYLIGTNITRQQVEVLSWETSPDDIISDAMNITIAIPGVFEYHCRYVKVQGQRLKHSEDLFVDGGAVDNFPVWIFDRVKYLPFGNSNSTDIIQNPYTLGLRLVDSDKLQEYTMSNPLPPTEAPKDAMNYFYQILSTIYHKQEGDHRKNLEQKRTIYIFHLGISAIQFDLDPSKQQALLQKGDMAVSEQFPKLEYDRRDNTKILDVWQAIITNNSVQVEAWIQRGFDPESRDSKGKTALDLAYENRRIPMLVYLITHGVMQTHYGKEISAILRPLLQNEAIDVVRLEKCLIAFEEKHLLYASEDVEENAMKMH